MNPRLVGEGDPGSVKGLKNGLRGTLEVLRDERTDCGMVWCKVRSGIFSIAT